MRRRNIRLSGGLVLPWFAVACMVLISASAIAQTEAYRLGDFLNGTSPEADEEAEIEEFIETDRNAFTFARLMPGTGRTIVEFAYSYIDIGSEGAKHSYPEFVARYGLNELIELRIGYNYETGPDDAEGDVVNNFGINAEQQLLYGFKFQITRNTEERRFLPDSALLVQGHTPVDSSETRSQIRLGYVWGWTLPVGWNLDMGFRFGTDREGEDGFELWAPSAVLRIPFGRGKRWFTHLEYFSVMSQDKEGDFSKQFVDTGLHYFITPDFEVGSIVAFGINEQTEGVLVNVGFGIRF